VTGEADRHPPAADEPAVVLRAGSRDAVLVGLVAAAVTALPLAA
jgi:hypothetical protein